jgi:hypothetical protein
LPAYPRSLVAARCGSEAVVVLHGGTPFPCSHAQAQGSSMVGDPVPIPGRTPPRHQVPSHWSSLERPLRRSSSDPLLGPQSSVIIKSGLRIIGSASLNTGHCRTRLPRHRSPPDLLSPSPVYHCNSPLHSYRRQ